MQDRNLWARILEFRIKLHLQTKYHFKKVLTFFLSICILTEIIDLSVYLYFPEKKGWQKPRVNLYHILGVTMKKLKQIYIIWP